MRLGSGVMASASFPHDFKQPSLLYYQVLQDKKYEFGVVAHGIISIPNFIKLQRYFEVITCVQTGITGAAQVRLVMPMRRRSCLMALLSFHLTNSINSHVGITEE
jgi:hypothetical protein